jgi:hypothetical protein
MPDMKQDDAALVPRIVEGRPKCDGAAVLGQRVAMRESGGGLPEEHSAREMGLR